MSKYSEKHQRPAPPCTALAGCAKQCAEPGAKLVHTAQGLQWHCLEHFREKMRRGDPFNPHRA